MIQYMDVLSGKAHIHIGKNGITQNQVEHIKTLLKSNKIIKIKILREISAKLGNEKIITNLIKELNVFVLDVRGNTFIISKKKIPGVHLPKKYTKIKSSLNPKIHQNKAESIDNTNESEQKELKIDEPEYIDYDNEELLTQIDEQSDLIYGSVPKSKEKIHEKPRRIPTSYKPKKSKSIFKKKNKKKSKKPVKKRSFLKKKKSKKSRNRI